MSEAWTIGELAERAAALLGSAPSATRTARGPADGRAGRSGGGAVNGRIREVPNERLIRWYTTIGLLDPPLGRRGRVALYGRRHLLQLVAVKRRQADGLSIAAIQAELAGATDAMLQRIAGLAADGVEITGRDGVETTGRDRFWTRDAAAPPATIREAPVTTPAAVTTPASEPASPADVVFGLRLTPEVTVVLDGAGRTPTPDQVAAVRRAAGPLLAALIEHGLIREGKNTP